jgi:uncharacterized protein (DUF488 family)
MKVFTWGYSGRSLDELVTIRSERGALIVDTRYSTRSRVVMWNREPLENRFGADYVWIREFGNVNYWNSDRAIELLNPTAGAKRLLDLVRDDRPPILICACPDIAVCHRAQVAAFLRERFGWEVEHLPTRSKLAFRARADAKRRTTPRVTRAD